MTSDPDERSQGRSRKESKVSTASQNQARRGKGDSFDQSKQGKTTGTKRILEPTERLGSKKSRSALRVDEPSTEPHPSTFCLLPALAHSPHVPHPSISTHSASGLSGLEIHTRPKRATRNGSSSQATPPAETKGRKLSFHRRLQEERSEVSSRVGEAISALARSETQLGGLKARLSAVPRTVLRTMKSKMPDLEKVQFALDWLAEVAADPEDGIGAAIKGVIAAKEALERVRRPCQQAFKSETSGP